LIRRYSRLCVFAYEYFIFLGRVASPSTKPPYLEDQFVSLSLVSLLRRVQLERSYQEHKVPAGIVSKVIETRKSVPPMKMLRHSSDNIWKKLLASLKIMQLSPFYCYFLSSYVHVFSRISFHVASVFVVLSVTKAKLQKHTREGTVFFIYVNL
jgi:hypothetical protein